METGYYVNVALHGRHVFRAKLASGLDATLAHKIKFTIIKKFPVAEGYDVRLQWCAVTMRDLGPVTPEDK